MFDVAAAVRILFSSTNVDVVPKLAREIGNPNLPSQGYNMSHLALVMDKLCMRGISDSLYM